MTHNEFISEALAFPPGKIVVISGPNLAKLFMLAMDTRDAIEAATEHHATVLDARALVMYPSDTKYRAISFEYVAVNSPNSVVLVPNRFDREDGDQNRTRASLEIDVVCDLMFGRSVETIPEAFSKTFPGTRNIFPFISSIYYYDTRNEEISFVKTQIPAR